MKLHRLAGIAAVLIATPAAAQEIDAASQRIEMIGTAPSACVLNAPTGANAVNASLVAAGPGGAEIRISQFVDPQTANPQASSIDLLLPVVCNSSHRLTVRSANGGLLRDGGNAANRGGGGRFGDFVGYDLAVDWHGRTLNAASDGGSLILDADNASAGGVSLRIATPAGSTPLTAGRYTDTVTIEFQAAN